MGLGIHFADLVMNFSERKWALKKLVVLPFIFLFDVINARLSERTDISRSAHMGGFVAGVLIGIVVGVNTVVKEHEEQMNLAAMGIGAGLMVFTLTWYATQWPPRNFGGESWCWARQVRNRTLFGDRDDHCISCSDEASISKWSKQLYIAHVSLSYCAALGGFDVSE